MTRVGGVVSAGARLCGGVVVGEGAHVGAGATVIQGVKVGANAVVGAGAVVIGDVPAGTMVVGSPARAVKRTDGRDGDAQQDHKARHEAADGIDPAGG